VVLHLVFLASHAYEMVDAISVTLVRLSITGRRLLEWETAAASDRRGGPPRLGAFLTDMIASPAIAGAALVLVAVIRPHALAAAVSVLLLWTAAPLIAYALSRP